MANEEQKELVKVLKELNSAIKEFKALAENLSKSFGDTKKIVQETKNTFAEINDYVGETIGNYGKVNKELEKERNIKKQLQKINDELSTEEKEKISDAEKLILAQENILKTEREQFQVTMDTLKIVKEKINSADDEKELLEAIHKDAIEGYEKEAAQLKLMIQFRKETNHLDKKKIENYKETKGFLEDIAKKIIGSKDYTETWLGKTKMLFGSMDNIKNTMKATKEVLLAALHPANLFANAVETVALATLHMGYKMDSTLASFQKATGAGAEYNDIIDDVRFGSLAAGVGMEESANAIQSLFLNLTGFNQMSEESQTELTRTTALFDRMGISAEAVAKNLDLSTKALGMNNIEAGNVQKQIAAVAFKLGLSPGMLASQFTASIPKLAQYGKQSVQIFKELAAQSKATGIEIGSLIGISQQFDTFEGAAEAAGKLNAILGGNLLNSVDLLTANEAERIDMLRESISLSGRNWSEMNRFEQMAIANAAGIKDMAEANRLFGRSSEEIEKAKQAVDANAMSTEEMEKRAIAATSAQEKMAKIIESLTVAALPLLNVINGILIAVLHFADSLGGKVAFAVVGITGLVLAAFIAFKVATGAVALFGVSLSVAIWPVTLVALAIAGVIGLVYVLIKYWDEIKAGAVNAFNYVNDAIKNATGGFYSLWDAANVVLGPVYSLISLGKLLYDNWDVAIGGVKSLLSGLANFFGNIINGIIDSISSVTDLIPGMGKTTKSNLATTGPDLASIGPSLVGIEPSLVPIEPSLAAISPKLAGGATDFGGGMALVGEHGPELVSLPEGSNVITNENSGKLTAAAESVQNSRIEQMTRKEESVRKSTETNNVISQMQKSGGGNNTSEIPVILQIDGREFGRAVINVFDRNMKLNMVGI